MSGTRNIRNLRARRQEQTSFLALELLEDRRLLSGVTAIVNGQGILVVTGTSGSDNISVAVSPGTGNQAAAIVVQNYGVGVAFPFSTTAVTGVQVDGGGGNDTISADLSTLGNIPMTINAGRAGTGQGTKSSDRTTFRVKESANSHSNFINGGAGNDVVELARGEAVVNGQGGNNIFEAGWGHFSRGKERFEPRAEGVTIDVDGGLDSGNLLVDGFQSINNFQTVYGGDGNDTLISTHAKYAVSLFGQGGNDTFKTDNHFADSIDGGTGVNVLAKYDYRRVNHKTILTEAKITNIQSIL